MFQKQPWHKLSQLLGARGVKADWTGFPENLLKPTNELAETFPCAGRCGGYMDVVKHNDGQHIGVCASGCDKRSLQKKDLIIHYPDTTAIFSGLGQAFGISATSHTIIDGIPACWQIGDYNPSASYRFPVATLFDAQASRIERVIGQLAARYKNPFFVLLPSASAVTQSVQDVALRNGCKVFAYEDLIEFVNNVIQVRGTAASILTDLSAGWIKQIDGQHGEYRYPTPAGAEWKDFLFEFTADEKLTVSCKKDGFQQICPEDLIMRNKRNKQPLPSWYFLKQLALLNNKMPVDDMEKMKVLKQEVSTKLKRVFQMTESPIDWVDDESVYSANFSIRANSSFAVHSKARKTAAA